MSTIVIPNTFTAGATIVAAEHNSNFSTIANDYNGNITNVNISGTAAIADSKLAQITTASKVDTDALTTTNKAQGDILYHNGTKWTRLGAGTANYPLVTNGAAANPAFEQLDLTSAVTGVLPIANGGTNQSAQLISWVIFDGTSANPITPSAQQNVSGNITKNGTGDYTINWSTSYATANYVVTGTALYDSVVFIKAGGLATGSVRINIADNASGSTIRDTSIICVQAIGNK